MRWWRRARIEAIAVADAAIAATIGRVYATALLLEADATSRWIFSTVPDTYPLDELKPLGDGELRRAIAAGEVFHAADSAAIARHYPDHPAVAALGATCLVNAPIVGADGRTHGLLNVAAARPLTAEEAMLIGIVAAVLGPVLRTGENGS